MALGAKTSNWLNSGELMVHDKSPICDGSGRPVDAGELLWTSTPTAWPGFRLETRRLLEHAHLVDVTQAYSVVALCASGVSVSEICNKMSAVRFSSGPGTIFLNCRGFQYDSISWSGSTDWLIVELDMSQLEPDADRRAFPEELLPDNHFVIHDDYMATLLRQMAEEARHGCPAGRLHGQSLSLALAAYIHGRYCPRDMQGAPNRTGLSAARTRIIRDYVHAHLAHDLSLHDLASVLHLSPSHFSELFRNTFGSTPYQYVLQERMAEARRLLASGRLSVVEVAHAIGYRDQSHFTHVFRKVTKTTPKQYQLQVATPGHRV
jgi:AraC family transcriptional regulator